MARAPLWYRKLEVREQGTFAVLPLYVRALAGQIMKLVDDGGRLELGGREPWEAIARAAGAEMGERRMLRRDVPLLLDQGYLHLAGGALVVTHLAEEAAAEEPEADASGARAKHDPSTTRARPKNDTRTKSDPSARNDSAGKSQERGSERREREEGSDPEGGAGFKLTHPEPKKAKDELVAEVLEHWASRGYHGRRPKLTEDRRVRVRSRLGEGFTVDELKLAVDGAARDAWLMGKAEGAPASGYKGVETILRDAKQVEKLRDLELAARGSSTRPAAARAAPTGLAPEVAARVAVAGQASPDQVRAALANIGRGARGVTPPVMALELDFGKQASG